MPITLLDLVFFLIILGHTSVQIFHSIANKHKMLKNQMSWDIIFLFKRMVQFWETEKVLITFKNFPLAVSHIVCNVIMKMSQLGNR